MSSYSNDLGFKPSTYDELTQRFYEITLQFVPHSMTFDEFLESNLYLVFQGVIRLKFEDDLLFARTINNFFQFLNESQILIENSTSNTYSGLYSALSEISDGVFFINYEYDTAIQPGEMVIVLDNPNTELIDDIMLNNLGVSVFTNPASTSYPPDVQRSFTLSNGQVIEYYYLTAVVVDAGFFVNIRYRLLDGAIVPVSEIEDIKTKFVEEFERVMKIGTKFEPERYVSSQNVPYVADFEVGYNLDGSSTFIYDVYDTPPNTVLKIVRGNVSVIGDL